MFTLWYSVLSWKEYRDTIQKSLFKATREQPASGHPNQEQKQKDASKPSQPQNIPKPTPSKIPQPLSTSPQPRNVSPQPQSSPKVVASPKHDRQSPKQDFAPKFPEPLQPTRIPSPQPVSRLQPLKPPRSPSPHPILSENMDDIDFNEDSEEEEEEDEDSIINGDDWPEDVRNPSQEIINMERMQQIRENAVRKPYDILGCFYFLFVLFCRFVFAFLINNNSLVTLGMSDKYLI